MIHLLVMVQLVNQAVVVDAVFYINVINMIVKSFMMLVFLVAVVVLVVVVVMQVLLVVSVHLLLVCFYLLRKLVICI